LSKTRKEKELRLQAKRMQGATGTSQGIKEGSRGGSCYARKSCPPKAGKLRRVQAGEGRSGSGAIAEGKGLRHGTAINNGLANASFELYPTSDRLRLGNGDPWRTNAVMAAQQHRRGVQSDIRRMVRRIRDRFNPERIILFGSHARGNAGPDSDVDLLVVMPVRGDVRRKRLEIRLALHDIHVPKDIIVTTPEDFQWRKDVVGTIERPAALEGKVLYVRA